MDGSFDVDFTDGAITIDEALEIQTSYEKQFILPSFLKRQVLIDSVKDFARRRYRLTIQLLPQRYDPIVPASHFFHCLMDEYPFPLTKDAILETCKRNGWDIWKDLDLAIPLSMSKDPLYAGLVTFRLGEPGTICYFIGTVQPNYVWESNYETRQLSEHDIQNFRKNVTFTFTDSMVIYDGKFDEQLFLKIKDVKKTYDKRYLGKVITGRPRIDPTNIMYAAREIVKTNPDISQEELTEMLGIRDISTFKKYRKAADYATYKDFKDSVKNS